MGVGKTTIGNKLCDKLRRSAFIDSNWCLDIHSFIGNKETKNTVNKIISGLIDVNIQIYSITLICSKESLIERWENDILTE